MNGSSNEKLAVAQLLFIRFRVAFSLSTLAGIGFLLNKKTPYEFPLFTVVRPGAGTEIATKNIWAERLD
jgi:hypothetical protein